MSASAPLYRDSALGWTFSPTVSGISDDSRQVRSGDIFVAIPGTHDDGRHYVSEAVERGAVAIVAERPLGAEVPVFVVPHARRALAELASAFFGDPWRGLDMIAVTGTAGKSTTVEWLLHILRWGGRQVQAVGSLHRPGVPEGVPGLTTPGPIALHRLIRTFRDQGATSVILEVTSHAIDQERVHGIRFRAAILTSLGRDHLDYHRDLGHYWDTKRRLFQDLGPDEAAFLPAEPLVAKNFDHGIRARVTRFGEDGEVTIVPSGSSFAGRYPARLVTPAGSAPFRMALPGPGMARSAAGAAACALYLGMDVASVAQALGELRKIPGRLERLVWRGITILIDYGHNPPGIETALQAAREVAGPGRVTVVLGAPGRRDTGKFPDMGRVVARAHRVILTSESPEGDSPEEIARLLAEGVVEAGGRPEILLDRQAAVLEALSGARAGDVVLLLGRGRERFQDFGNVVLLGSDLDLVERAKAMLVRGSEADHEPDEP